MRVSRAPCDRYRRGAGGHCPRYFRCCSRTSRCRQSTAGIRDARPASPATQSADGPMFVRWQSDAAHFLRGSIIVKFRAGTSPAAQRAHARAGQRSATPRAALRDFDIVSIDRIGRSGSCGTRDSTAQPDVEYAQARYRVSPAFIPNDPLYSRQWNYPAIDMERAWDINPGRDDLDHGRRPRQRRGVPVGDRAATTRAASTSSVWPVCSRRSAPSTCRSRRRRISAGPIDSSHHATSSGTRRCRSISTVMARTWPARRPAHQQRRRRRRHGVQRPHHAGEGDRRRLGLHLQQPVPVAPTTWWRAGSDTPPTTAPMSST